LLPRILYAAQIFPLTTDSRRQHNTAISWFIWRGEIFRVPLFTLQCGRDVGDGTLKIYERKLVLFLNIGYKCRQTGMICYCSWFMRWNIQSGAENSPNLDLIPTVLGYLREYVADVAHNRSRDNTESAKAYKEHLYTTLKALISTDNTHQGMKITRLWPHGFGRLYRQHQYSE